MIANEASRFSNDIHFHTYTQNYLNSQRVIKFSVCICALMRTKLIHFKQLPLSLSSSQSVTFLHKFSHNIIVMHAINHINSLGKVKIQKQMLALMNLLAK